MRAAASAATSATATPASAAAESSRALRADTGASAPLRCSTCGSTPAVRCSQPHPSRPESHDSTRFRCLFRIWSGLESTRYGLMSRGAASVAQRKPSLAWARDGATSWRVVAFRELGGVGEVAAADHAVCSPLGDVAAQVEDALGRFVGGPTAGDAGRDAAACRAAEAGAVLVVASVAALGRRGCAQGKHAALDAARRELPLGLARQALLFPGAEGLRLAEVDAVDRVVVRPAVRVAA